MSRKVNRRKENFLASIPKASLGTGSDTLAKKCKFNFSYFDSGQYAGLSFSDLTQEQLIKLFEKLRNYSEFDLMHWRRQPIGKGVKGKGRRCVLEVYGDFPRLSDFTHPPSVPHQALWGRFRLESDMRLIGFVIPQEFNDTHCSVTGYRFDNNVFYVVFLDAMHRFYLSK